MSVKSYGFAIGNLRARENTLLKRNDLLQLISSEDTAELFSMLKDKGIGYSVGGNSCLEAIKSHTSELWKYLADIAPDMSAFEPFIYENDFHNLKAVLKSVLKNTDFTNLLIIPASIDISLIERAIKEKRFDLLPEFMAGAAKEAYEILTQTGDAQLADSVLDAACMKAQLKRAYECKVGIVADVIKTTVFYNNIKAALRAAKASKSSDFIDSALTDTDVVPKKELKAAALAGEEKVLELLSRITELKGETAAECYREAAWKFEKFIDDLIMKKVSRCKSVTMGIEPLLGYMIARKTEIKNLSIIYSGVKTGQPREITEERLREVYG